MFYAHLLATHEDLAVLQFAILKREYSGQRRHSDGKCITRMGNAA
jgi:hypothetical protein